MATPMDNSHNFFDLDFLLLGLGPAPTSIPENNNTTKDGNVDQNSSNLVNTEHVHAQNEGNTEATIQYENQAQNMENIFSTDYSNQVQNMGYTDHEMVSKAEYSKLLKCYEEKNKDYEQLKKQYAKLGLDYAALHDENIKSGLGAIKANTSCDKLKAEIKVFQNQIHALENENSVAKTMNKAKSSTIVQFSKLVETLQSDVANLKNMYQSEREAHRDGKKLVTSLKFKNKTVEEHACILARVIEKKHPVDPATQRLIKKYNRKKTDAELEDIDRLSVDTGRGSSFSNYSPAYSINFSPLNMIDRYEQRMKDASTSPPPTNKTLDTASSPISFEVQTEPLESNGVNFDSSDITTAVKKMLDIATSPIPFVDNSSQDMAKTKVTGIASGPISFISPVPKANMLNITSSPIRITKSPMSPSSDNFASSKGWTPLKSDVTSSAIKPTDMTMPSKPVASPGVKTPEVTRPLKPTAVSNTIVITPEITRPLKPTAESNTMVLTPEIIRPLKPIVSNTMVITPEITEITSPLKPTALSNIMVITSEITSSLKPTAVSNTMVVTPEITSPQKPTDVTNTMVITPVITSPLKPTDVTNTMLITQEITGPLKTTAVSNTMVITPEITSPLKPTDVSNTMVITPEITMPLKPTAVSNTITPEITSPLKPTAMSNIMVITPPERTSSLKPTDVSNTMVITPEITMPLKPTAVSNTMVITPDITSPLKPTSMSNTIVITPEITSPLKPTAMSNLMVITPPEKTSSLKPTDVSNTMVITPKITSPLKPTDVSNTMVITPEITMPLKPTAVSNTMVITPEITSPLKPTAMSNIMVITPPEITSSLKPTDVSNTMVITPNITSPLKPTDVSNTMVITPEITMPLKPTAVSNTMAITPEKTSPLKPTAMSNITLITPEKTSPLKPSAVSNTMVVTPNITSPFKPSAVSNTMVKTPEITMPLKPTSVTKNTDLLDPVRTNDTNDVKNQRITTKLSEMSRPIETTDFVNQVAETTISEQVKSPVNNRISVISKTPDLTQLTYAAVNVRRSVIQIPSKNRPYKHADPKSLLIKINTPDEVKQNENVESFSSDKSFNETINENQSHIVHEEEEERDDFEVRLILSKCRLDLNVLSPMSITPDLDEESLMNSKSDVRNDEIERENNNYGSQLNEESNSLFVISPVSKRLSIPQNKANTLKHKINEDNPSHFKKNVSKHQLILPVRRTLVHERQLTQSDKIMHLKNQEATVKRINRKIEMPQTLSEPTPNVGSLGSQLDLQYSESNSLSHTSRNLLTESQDPNKKEYLLTEKQVCRKVSKPPEKQVSESIKSTIPTAQFQTESVPQTQSKLQSVRIEEVSVSIDTLNTCSVHPPIPSNPEYGRKRTICRSMEAQSDNKHSKRLKISESDTSKVNSAEIFNEDKFTYSYSKLPMERISRVKASVSSNPISVPNNNQSENISERKGPTLETNNKDLYYAPAPKRAKTVDYKTGFVKPDQNMKEYASTSTENNDPGANLNSSTTTTTIVENVHQKSVSEIEQSQNEHKRYCADYNDFNIFKTDNNNLKTHINKMNKKETYDWTHNLLDRMIFEYGSNTVLMNKSKIMNKAKCDEQIAKQLENAVAKCVYVFEDRDKYFKTLQEAAAELEKQSDVLKMTGGLLKYLRSSERKAQFVSGNKNRSYNLKPNPTKYVVALIDILDRIDKNGLKIWMPALATCEYLLFTLDKESSPKLDVVESVTHLFVYMCKYRTTSKNLVVFMLNAMYCANYKAIIIIKHCLDLAPEILPHAKEKIHPYLAPLFQTVIFLLHFYNCDDPFNKVQDFRFTLQRRYCYDTTQENETTLLYKLKQTIIDINDHYFANDTLRWAILLLAKRKGTKWCHKNIVQKILLPIIKGEIHVSKEAFRLCIAVILQLLKPYKNEMAVHCVEVVNLLMNIIEQPHPQEVKEDIISGLIYMNMKNVSKRIDSFLANWNPPSISPKFEEALKIYITSRPLKSWMYVNQQ